MQFCKITIYFVWLRYFQTIQYPDVSLRCVIVSEQHTASSLLSQNTPAPSSKYLWFQHCMSRQSGAAESVTHSDRCICIHLYKVDRVNSTLWQNTQNNYIIYKGMSNEQYHGSHFNAARCILFWDSGWNREKEAHNFQGSEVNCNLSFPNLMRATEKKNSSWKSHHCWNVWWQNHTYNVRESVRKVHAKGTNIEALLILEGQIFFLGWNSVRAVTLNHRDLHRFQWNLFMNN